VCQPRPVLWLIPDSAASSHIVDSVDFADSADSAPSPLSSTAATILENPDGSLYAVLGGSGGSRIFPSIAQVLLHLAAGYNLSEAIEKRRYHNQVVPPITTIEVGPEGEDVGLSKALQERGHRVGLFDINIGVSESECGRVGRGRVGSSRVESSGSVRVVWVESSGSSRVGRVEWVELGRVALQLD
jgi:gamma-glutamyltranspeptidase